MNLKKVITNRREKSDKNQGINVYNAFVKVFKDETVIT